MNDKTQTADTTGPLYRVNFTFVHNNRLRNGTYILNAKTEKEAREAAQKLLNEEKAIAARIGKITIYQ